MENLLALAELDAFLQLCFGDFEVDGGNLFVVDEDAALLHQTAGFAVGTGQLTCNHQIQNTDLTIDQLIRSDFSGGHIGVISTTGKQSLGRSLCLGGFFLTMNQLGQFKGQQGLSAKFLHIRRWLRAGFLHTRT